MPQITTISFFKYQGLKNQIWALGMMQFAHNSLTKAKGQSFYKLMGSGKGIGFNPLPDWSTYCLLQVWESETAANIFFENSTLIKRYQKYSSNIWTLFMKNIKSKGVWSGSNPFKPSKDLDKNNPRLAIITRATIKWSKLRKFWSYVPKSHEPLKDNSGLIYTKGIGEVPIIQMATFSLWENETAVRQYAYQSQEHTKAIKMSSDLKWYKEELFARFQVYKEKGPNLFQVYSERTT